MNLFEETQTLAEVAVAAAAATGARSEDAPSSVRNRATPGRAMSGAIDDFPLPYLLQLLESSQKSGVLVIRASSEEIAKLYLRKGAVVYASMSGGDEIRRSRLSSASLTGRAAPSISTRRKSARSRSSSTPPCKSCSWKSPRSTS